MAAQPEVRNYSILHARLRANALNMTSEQSANWQRLVAHVTPVLRHLKTLSDELQHIRTNSRDVTGKIEHLKQECQAISSASSCQVECVAGDTVVRTLRIRAGATPLHMLPARELRIRLRETGADSTILFNGSEGEFAWKASS